MTISSTNITSLATHKWTLIHMEVIRCIQEHQLPHSREHAFRRHFRKECSALHIDPSFGQGANFSAGTGFVYDNDIIVRPIVPFTGPLVKPHKNGRISICTVVASTTLSFFIYNVYGFVISADDNFTCIRTEALMEGVFDDWIDRGCPPAIITGDLNADAMKVPSIAKLINVKGWLDVGSRASPYGKMDNQPTCIAPNYKTKTRRDYILASPQLVPSFTDFNIQDDGTFHVHASISITSTVVSEPYTALSFTQVPPIIQPPATVEASRKEWVQSIKEIQTPAAIRNNQTFIHHQSANDTNALWQHVWTIFELGLLTVSNSFDLKGNHGRGKLRYDNGIRFPRLTTQQHNPSDSLLNKNNKRTTDLEHALTDRSKMEMATSQM